ncbi:MAG: thioredoxin family protein [Gemmatimonadales bacterium]|nr:thioredoxin family protein [Gemmatimonadales bacterium]
MAQRTVEVFIAGCPVCDDALQSIRKLVCESCDLQVQDMRTPGAQAKAKKYGIRRVPSVVVNGQLAECCQTGGIDTKTLQRLGVGTR